MRLRTTLVASVCLSLVSGCPQRWDPESPPGVSTGRSGGGEPAHAAQMPEGSILEPLDDVVSGELADGDHVLEVDGTLYDELAFDVITGSTIVVTMQSTDFDPYLHLIGPNGEQLAHRGTPPDEPGNSAELVVVAPETGQYRVYANALDPAMRGAYEVRIVVQPPPRSAPP